MGVSSVLVLSVLTIQGNVYVLEPCRCSSSYGQTLCGYIWDAWCIYSCLTFLTANNETVTHYLEIICGALRDLVPFVQFKKREKHPWRSITLCFSRFLNCTNGTESRITSQIFWFKRLSNFKTQAVFFILSLLIKVLGR